MRLNSLSFRLTASAALVSLFLLVVAGFALNQLFRAALESNFDARLQAVMDGLLANVEIDDAGEPFMPGAIADTRFELPVSGWYWQVKPVNGPPERELVAPSLLEQRLELPGENDPSRDKNGVAHVYMTDSNGVHLRVIEQRYTLFGAQEQFSFLVAGNFDELKREISAFQNTLAFVLTLLGAGLLLAILVQVLYGLRPLRILKRELTDIRQGNAEVLSEKYPSDIEPVANELNLLIDANTQVVERARTQVGNLAHALKTPLSVLANEAEVHEGPLANKVGEQTRVMRDQVSMYLDRARRAARARSLGQATDVDDVVQAIARTLQKINQDNPVEVEVRCSPGLKFRGERQDLEEMIGNLLENAFKWTHSQISVTGRLLDPAAKTARSWLEIDVSDDGPGLPENLRQAALKRGERLDETKPGSGLGLSIVSETAAMYDGEFRLEAAETGGLSAILKLPASASGS
jgi:signal transduction histidine kinase